MRRVAWIGAVLALGLVATACGGGTQPQAEQTSGGGEEEGGTITIAGKDATDHGSADVTGQDEVKLEQDDFYFEPTVLTGEAGQTLKVELENEGNVPHTFTIDELNVDEEVQPGAEGEAQITFPKSGALLFYCRFHASRGMRGGASVGGDLGPAKGIGGGSGSGGSSSGYPVLSW